MSNYDFDKYERMLSSSGGGESKVDSVIVEEVQHSASGNNQAGNNNSGWTNNNGASSSSGWTNNNGGSSSWTNNNGASSSSGWTNNGNNGGSSNWTNNGNRWGNNGNNGNSGWTNSGNQGSDSPSRELVTQEESHYVKLEGMAEILNHFGIKADPNSACIYKPASTKAPVLPVPEIRDSNGRLAQKIKRLEQITHLSVIPFELSGLNSKVVEISGYTIYTLAGRRFISSRLSPVYSEDELIEIAQNLIAKYCDAGGELKESLRTTVFLDRNTKTPTDPSNPNAVAVNTIAFNNYEIDFLTGALRELKASVICTGDDIFLVSGDLKGDM